MWCNIPPPGVISGKEKSCNRFLSCAITFIMTSSLLHNILGDITNNNNTVFLSIYTKVLAS